MLPSLSSSATADASALQAPHHGAQNQMRTSLPISEAGLNVSPESVLLRRASNALGNSVASPEVGGAVSGVGAEVAGL